LKEYKPNIKRKNKLKSYWKILEGWMRNPKKERKEKKSSNANPERITPHMPLKEVGHVVVN